MTACAYRSLEPVLEERLIAIREQRLAAAPYMATARRVAARRLGRAVGGGVAVSFALLSFASSLVALADASPPKATWQVAATLLLLSGWGAGVAAALVTRLVSQRALRAWQERPIPLSGDATVDLARLAVSDPLVAARTVADRRERASVALPMAAVSLLAPLTLHWLVWVAFSPEVAASSFKDFGEWIGWSAVLVGHAHLAVLAGAVKWAFSLRTRATVDVRHGLMAAWGLTLLVAVGVAALPGIVLIGIPPILVGVTGLVFLPALFLLMARRVCHERLALETV